MEDTKIVGADISLNHGALVMIENGALLNFRYYTTYAGSVKKSVQRGQRMDLGDKKVDRQILHIKRLVWIENFIKNTLDYFHPDYVGIEDYALDAKHGSHYQGEAGGVIRLIAWHKGINMRLHDPISLKMFTTHNGTAGKEDMEEAVLRRWAVDFGSYNQPPAKPTAKIPRPKQNRQTSQDLCDAFALAQLVHLEVMLRAGKTTLQQLHEKEVRVFNRVTKSHPTSLLDRAWIVASERWLTPSGTGEGQ